MFTMVRGQPTRLFRLVNARPSRVVLLAVASLVVIQSACIRSIGTSSHIAGALGNGPASSVTCGSELLNPVSFDDPFAPPPPLGSSASSNAVLTERSVEDFEWSSFSLNTMAVSGVSPVGMAFVFAWYSDALRLFKLLDILKSRNVDVQHLRWANECLGFTTDEAGYDLTLVHVAVLRGNIPLVRQLAEYGMPVDDRGAEGMSPSPLKLLLDRDSRSFGTVWPDRKTFHQMVALLLELGAKPTFDGALWQPIGAKDGPLLEMLLAAGADPNRPIRVSLDSPLHLACDSPELIRVLLRHGANPYATNSMGFSVFDYVPFKPGLGEVLEEFK